MGSWVLVAGCSARVTLREAVLQAEPDSANTGEYTVSISIQRDDLLKIVNNHIFSYIQLIDCHSRKDFYTVLPQVEGSYIGDFEDLGGIIRRDPKKTFIMMGKLKLAKKSIGYPFCATLDGGGYKLVKVRASIIPVTWKSP
jgi:hypothetical protein